MKRNLDAILVVDRSSSMQESIDLLNICISDIVGKLKTIPGYTANCKLYMSILQFPVFKREDTFVWKAVRINRDEEELVVPKITAKGATNPAVALNIAVDFVIERYAQWREKGLKRIHPIIFFVTDGKPNAGSDTPGGPVDPEEQRRVLAEYENAALKIQRYEKEKKLQFYGFGIGNADLDMIRKLTSFKGNVFDYTEMNMLEALDAFKNHFLMQTGCTTNNDGKVIVNNKK